MILVISPAKTLDFESENISPEYSIPKSLEKSEKIVNKLKKMSVKKIGELMSISKDLSKLNQERYLDWGTDFNAENGKPAIQAFKGDVYLGLDVQSFTQEDLGFANEHLRILSGLHGVLRPLDLIRPYRLEMGTKLPVLRKKNLYEFWQDEVTKRVNGFLQEVGSEYLINLASDEYFNVINTTRLKATIIKPSFKDFKNGQYKVLSFFAKKARGMMSAYIIKNRITSPEEIKGFDADGYSFNAELSNNTEWVFTRNNEN
ncbi:MAG: peroxide stress protein YaaA [Bacteroidia bacterium]